MKPPRLDIPARSIATILGGFMFVKGVADLIPPMGNVGLIAVGGFLLWWGKWRKVKR